MAALASESTRMRCVRSKHGPRIASESNHKSLARRVCQLSRTDSNGAEAPSLLVGVRVAVCSDGRGRVEREG
eukprot:6407027-Alexandrium_andersonii.AAC.1